MSNDLILLNWNRIWAVCEVNIFKKEQAVWFMYSFQRS